jgi:hypothetical protein
MKLMTPFFSLPLPITMLKIFILALSLASCMGRTINTQEVLPLFLIVENDKYGFINGTGHIVIEPQFLALGEFSDGLAYARTNGLYGYIDCTGAFVIAPRFEYATPFSDGLAVVYTDGKPFYIDTKGRKQFECNYPFVDRFEDGKALIRTSSDKFGVISKQGRFIIDTLFTVIKPVAEDLMIVHGLNHQPFVDHRRDLDKVCEVGVIDTSGNFVIPYGKYDIIVEYNNGYFRANLPEEPWDTIEGYTASTAIIDRTGNIVVSKDHKNHCFINGNMHCGLVKMHLYKYLIPEEKGVLYTTTKGYQGFMNMKGEISINDSTFEQVEQFADNRAFVRDDKRRFSIINTEGKVVGNTLFSGLLGTGFKNGLAFVEVGQKWGLIDTNAQFVIEPKFSCIFHYQLTTPFHYQLTTLFHCQLTRHFTAN